MLKDNRLVAQAVDSPPGHVLRLVVLDVKEPNGTSEVFPVELSAGVVALVEQRAEMHFSAQARAVDDDVLISWRFTRRERRGDAISSDPSRPGDDQTGMVRLDLANHRATAVPTEEVPPETERPLPENIGRMIETRELAVAPLRAGNVLAAFESPEGSRGPVVLKRWSADSGEPLESVTLFEGGMSLRNRSSDGRHILASRPAPTRAGNRGEFMWSLFALETGDRVGECRSPAPGGLFIVANSVLVQMLSRQSTFVDSRPADEPLRLRATDLTTGAALWEHPVRETAFRGADVPDARHGEPKP